MNTFFTLLNSTRETLYMVSSAGLISIALGLPLGIFLYINTQPEFQPRSILKVFANTVVNVIRSIPFIILMVAILPFTRLIMGTGIGTSAAIVPLACAATPFFARITETALLNLPSGLLESSIAMGATKQQIIIRILLPESAADLVRGITLMLITLIGYSAMAGAIGGGGLGSLAIQYGYQRFDTFIMASTTLILVCIVQILQVCGNTLAKKLTH